MAFTLFMIAVAIAFLCLIVFIGSTASTTWRDSEFMDTADRIGDLALHQQRAGKARHDEHMWSNQYE